MFLLEVDRGLYLQEVGSREVFLQAVGRSKKCVLTRDRQRWELYVCTYKRSTELCSYKRSTENWVPAMSEQDWQLCSYGVGQGSDMCTYKGWTELRTVYLQKNGQNWKLCTYKGWRTENCLPTRDGQNLELCTCKGWTQFRSVFKYTHGVDRSENMYL